MQTQPGLNTGLCNSRFLISAIITTNPTTTIKFLQSWADCAPVKEAISQAIYIIICNHLVAMVTCASVLESRHFLLVFGKMKSVQNRCVAFVSYILYIGSFQSKGYLQTSNSIIWNSTYSVFIKHEASGWQGWNQIIILQTVHLQSLYFTTNLSIFLIITFGGRNHINSQIKQL